METQPKPPTTQTSQQRKKTNNKKEKKMESGQVKIPESPSATESQSNETPKKKKNEMESGQVKIPDSPSSSYETPKRKKKTDSVMTCSIMNVSNLLQSPPKPGSSKTKPTSYITFGITNKDNKKVCRSVSFHASHIDFLQSDEMKSVINNPNAAIDIHNVHIEEGGGIQLNSHSKFGNVVALENPYVLENPKVVSIFDVKFKLSLLTEVSVEGCVVRINEEYSPIQKKKIYKYWIANKHEISISSFFPLACEVGQAYVFNSVVLDVYKDDRILKYEVTSNFVKSLNVFQSNVEPVNSKKTFKVNTIKLVEQDESTPSCTECQKPLDDVDDDGYYECECGACGTVEKSNSNKSYTLSTIVDTTGEEMLLQLSEELFKKFAQSKKDIVTNKWMITYNSVKDVVMMEKQ